MIQEIKKGQNDWQKPVNDLIDFANANLQVQSLSGSSAFTTLNGATSNNHGSIQWVNLKGGKLVTVNVNLTTPDKVNSEAVYGQIPANLAPNDTITTASSYYENSGTEIDAEGQLYSAGTTGGKGGLTRWNATYIRKD